MSADSGRGKQPISAAMVGPYGHPFHPMLVTVPIGAWISSLVLDIGSYIVTDGSALVTAAAWLIAIGVVGALAAAMVGLLDLFGIQSGSRAEAAGAEPAEAHFSVPVVVAHGLGAVATLVLVLRAAIGV